MSVVLGLWHLTLEGGKEKTFQTPANVQITNAAFGEEIAEETRTVVKLTFDTLNTSFESDDEDEEEEKPSDTTTTVLCSLIPGKVEQANINLTLDSEGVYTFQATGKNTVYLTGNYIRQLGDDEEPSDDEDFSDEEGYDLRDVSSDVEMHPDDLEDLESDASRFEEVVEEPVKASKRPRDSDAKEPEASKKASKKLKAEGGKAVEAEAPKEEKKEKKQKEKKEKKDEKPTEVKEKKEKFAKKTIAGGVVIQDAKVGTGPMAKKGNTVRMRYVGKLTNGKEFDKNVSGKPFTFHLGKGEVIKGWDEGIVGMQVGGERILTIPPAMGYGSKKQDVIPANSTLIFEVKLLEIK
ncbi:FK506-binding protein 4 [Psilocybe cubensis]|uniref:peptidylprolyl isomerase n=2 Tax=Psilocybe cubensis TaxID=181762 RepID=A0A8H7Y4G1_PSICU|nr:FK506-binding protein 4 [Psilocybe cubensis]KAH9485049.1 FK506-binding protein 4 [Psilocybe cubensis]